MNITIENDEKVIQLFCFIFLIAMQRSSIIVEGLLKFGDILNHAT